MSEYLFEAIDCHFKDKTFLTLSEISKFLDCPPQVVYNWTKRPDPKKRPPRITVGREMRFPKKDFIAWLIEEQGRSN